MPPVVHFVREPEPGDANVTADPRAVTCPTCARKLGVVSFGLAPEGVALCVSDFPDECAAASSELAPVRDPLPRGFIGLPPVLAPLGESAGILPGTYATPELPAPRSPLPAG